MVANWMTGALAARLNEAGVDVGAAAVTPAQLRALVQRIADGTLSSKTAREVFEALWAGEGEVDAIVERRGLRQISDTSELDRLADEVLAANAPQVADYRAGKSKAFNALVGQMMKASKGKANPQQVNEILRRKLDATP
jgi:aspartyl-tRNA(Asn)/glutamyl-tRNA(Gln) amidotransferase subunit B